MRRGLSVCSPLLMLCVCRALRPRYGARQAATLTASAWLSAPVRQVHASSVFPLSVCVCNSFCLSCVLLAVCGCVLSCFARVCNCCALCATAVVFFVCAFFSVCCVSRVSTRVLSCAMHPSRCVYVVFNSCCLLSLCHLSCVVCHILCVTCPTFSLCLLVCLQGGTIAALSTFFKARNPGCAVYLIDPPGSGLYSYLTQGKFESSGTTITEGIGIMRLVANFAQAKAHVDGAFQGSDQEAVDMAYFLLQREGLWVGPSAALNCVGAVKVRAIHSFMHFRFRFAPLLACWFGCTPPHAADCLSVSLCLCLCALFVCCCLSIH